VNADAPIRGVIFDLDDTLFDCTGQLTIPARQRAASILARDTNQAEAELTLRQSDLAETLGSSGAIRAIGSELNLSDNIVDEALASYNRDDVPPIRPFNDAVSTLEALAARGLPLTLVTTGRRNRQLAKVERIGLSTFFSPQANLFIHEEGDHPDKEPQLRAALAATNLAPDQTMSVGDKLDSDIRVGNRIGLITVRFRHGRQKELEPEQPLDRPDYDIQRLGDLLEILNQYPT
jgi:FMN phosphatase YigB (HAD superfamily)